MTEEAADAAMAFLMKLDPAVQRAVLERFEEALAVAPSESSDHRRIRRAGRALHEAKRILGRSPSVREYKKLRREHPEHEWPETRSVTRWLGVRSWNDALVRMRLEPLAEGDVIEGAIGPTYTVEDVLQALRDCAHDLGQPPTITDYFFWVRHPDVRDRPGRRPGSTWIFNRIFGGFRQARIAAGLEDGDPTAAHPTEVLIRSANYRLPDEQILDDIRLAASVVDQPLTQTVYDRARATIYRESKAAGRPRALAGVGTIYRHFRYWAAALEAAGVEIPDPDTRSTKHRLQKEQLLHALSEGYEAAKGRYTQNAYLAWRDRECERDPRRRRTLPGSATIGDRKSVV